MTDATGIYELAGYTVLPPRGKNWFELRRDNQQALFGKKIESPTHSFVATATSGVVRIKFESVAQFQEYIDKMRAADIDSSRKIVEYASAPDPTFPAWCVKYHLKTADLDAPNAQGRALLHEDVGVSCVHPTRPGLIVDVGYSERGRPAEIGGELRLEGERFMRSLSFSAR